MQRMRISVGRLDTGLLVVLIICLIAVWPFIGRESLPQETDTELHVFRLHELSYLVRNGELFPRWAPNFYHGYGYPIFNYYAPLTYYLGLGVEIWPRFDAVDGVKAVFILGLLSAAIGMYGFVKEHWGRTAGHFAAAIYIYSPYLQYIDPHARGVLAESFSFGVFPLALWFLDRLRREGGIGNWVFAVTMIAAVILSHNLMALLFFGLLTSWGLWSFVGNWIASHRNEGLPGVSYYRLMFASLLLGLGLAAFFWLTVYLERNAVNLSTLIGAGDNFDFRTHFLSWGELLSASRRLDWAATEPAFVFNLGLPQWIFALIGILFLVFRRLKHEIQAVFFALALIIFLFLMLPSSTFVWENVPLLPFFQFPWRFLGPAAAMAAVLSGAALPALIELTEALALRIKSTLFSVFVSQRGVSIFCIVLPILFGLPLSQPAPWPEFGEVNTLRMSLIEHQGRWLGTTSTADYVPATVDAIPRRNSAVVAGLYEDGSLDRVNRAEGMIPDGSSVEEVEKTPLEIYYQVFSPEEFLLRLFIFDFPGWRVTVDGDEVETELGRPEGFIVVPVPKGQHEVKVEFGTTPARTWSATISVLSLLSVATIGWYLSKRRAIESMEKLTADRVRTGNQRHDIGVITAVLAVTGLHLLVFQPLGWLHLYSAPFSAIPADVDSYVDFGGQVALIGYDLLEAQAEAGDEVDVTLYWQAQESLDINFQVFVHLLRPNGRLVAQSDKLNPGDFPTRRWPIDKYVRDVHKLSIPEDLPPGDYDVRTGLWVRSEGWRLPLLDESGEQIGDSYLLSKLRVGPHHNASN